MGNCEMKFDLYQLAIDAGMTDEEFHTEIGRLFAAKVSISLEENPGQMIVYTVNYIDHDIEIIARRVSDTGEPINTSIN